MKCVSIIACIFLLIACGEEKKRDVIDMTEITPRSERNYDEGTKESIDTIDFKFDQSAANELGMNLSGLKFFNLPLLPDRFSPKSSNKLVLMQEADSTVFCQWVFKDSLKTMNALFNWLDCFGPKCKSIKYRFNENFQSEHMLIFVNDTSITYISSEQILSEKDWQSYFETVHRIEDWENVIIQKAGRKAVWYSYGLPPGAKEKKFIVFKE